MPAWSEPRVAPPTLLPAARRDGRASSLALPVFLIAGWPIDALGDRGRALGRLPGDRLPPRRGSRSGWIISPPQAVAMASGCFRAIAVMVILIVVTVTGHVPRAPGRVAYALAFTVEFGAVAGRVLRRGGEGRVRLEARTCSRCGRSRCSRRRPPSRARTFDPSDEFELNDVGPDPPRPARTCRSTRRSSTCCSAPSLTMPDRDRLDALAARRASRAAGRPSARWSTTSRRRRSPRRACRTRRSGAGSRTCATLLIFIFVVNLLGFIPLPLTGETWHGVPVWGIYAATSSISVTLALALLTWIFTAHRGHPLERRRSSTSSRGSRRCRRRCSPLIVPIEISRSSCA